MVQGDRLAGLVVVVTGASSGIGAATVEALGAVGAVPVLVARRADALQDVAQRCGSSALWIAADVTHRAAVTHVVHEVIERAGHIDVWVNNAGQGITRLPSQLTDDDLDAMMRANVHSALYGMQEVLPHFLERSRGQIINVSSSLGRVPVRPFRSAYSAAKHFLNGITADFRAELAEHAPFIDVSLVSPGAVRTAFGTNARHGGPDSRSLDGAQSPEEVADVLLDVMRRPRRDVYTRPMAREEMLEYFAELTRDSTPARDSDRNA